MLTQRSNVMLIEVEASKNHIKIDPSYRQDDNIVICSRMFQSLNVCSQENRHHRIRS